MPEPKDASSVAAETHAPSPAGDVRTEEGPKTRGTEPRGTPPEFERYARLIQYRELWADVRAYDDVMWQIPSAIAVIAGLTAAVSSVASSTPTIGIAASIVGITLTLALWVSLIKNRFFQESKVDRLRDIEDSGDVPGLLAMPRTTLDWMKFDASFRDRHGERDTLGGGYWRSHRAFTWLRCAVIVVLSVEILLGLYYVTRAFDINWLRWL